MSLSWTYFHKSLFPQHSSKELPLSQQEAVIADESPPRLPWRCPPSDLSTSKVKPQRASHSHSHRSRTLTHSLPLARAGVWQSILSSRHQSFNFFYSSSALGGCIPLSLPLPHCWLYDVSWYNLMLSSPPLQDWGFQCGSYPPATFGHSSFLQGFHKQIYLFIYFVLWGGFD